MTTTPLQDPPNRGHTVDAPVIPAAVGASPKRPRRTKRVGATKRLSHVALWARQVYMLVRSGTPLAQTLQAVELQTGAGPWKDVLSDVRTQVDEGHALSEAMERHPDWFDPVCRSLIAAGESAGQLDAMLERLSMLTRQQLHVRRSLIGAMVYPLLLMTVAASVLIIMICFVFPRFAELFATLDAPLPPTTKMLIVISSIFRGWWWAIGGLLIGGAVGGHFYINSDAGRRVIDGWVIKVPMFGKIVRSFATARIARLLGALVESRVPLLDALELTRFASTNSYFSDLIGEAEEAVTRGEAMSDVFRRSELISPSVTEAVKHGEQNGQVGSVLTDMADFLDEENETIVRTLTSILEPMILIVLGAMVAFVALSMFLPLFDLTSMTGGP